MPVMPEPPCGRPPPLEIPGSVTGGDGKRLIGPESPQFAPRLAGTRTDPRQALGHLGDYRSRDVSRGPRSRREPDQAPLLAPVTLFNGPAHYYAAQPDERDEIFSSSSRSETSRRQSSTGSRAARMLSHAYPGGKVSLILKDARGLDWTPVSKSRRGSDLVSSFRRALLLTFGNLVRAWRLALDPSNIGHLNWHRFEEGMQVLRWEYGLQADFAALFAALDANGSGSLSLDEVDPQGAELLGRFKEQAGPNIVSKFLGVLGGEEPMTYRSFGSVCRSLLSFRPGGTPIDMAYLCACLDLDDSGMVTFNDLHFVDTWKAEQGLNKLLDPRQWGLLRDFHRAEDYIDPSSAETSVVRRQFVAKPQTPRKVVMSKKPVLSFPPRGASGVAPTGIKDDIWKSVQRRL
mmetsp:Transcript_97315/g.259850  ORF Transcript_97315/g.259850 Transcript_97315/m.259850 type:complete len:403 (-) Transcript_97315:503-1711(-)